MPPKKKRGAQTPVTIPVVKKMSTRSRKKTEKGEALVLAKPPKAPKKPKAPTKPKIAKKPPAKKKGGKSSQPQPVEPVLEIEPEPEPEPDPEPEPESAPAPEESMTHESTADENVFDELVLEDSTLEEKEEIIETVVEDDEQMDTTELPSEATEEISQQLEALDVTESQDGSVLELENVDDQVIEYECLDYTVEYVTEDFVPVAEDTEIVIEEEEEEEEGEEEEEESESPNFELLESMQNVYIEKVEPKVEEELEPVSTELEEETIDEVEAKLVELVKSEEPEARSEETKAAEFKSIEAELAGFEAEPADNPVEVKQDAPLDIPVVIEPAELKSVEAKPDEQKSSETKTIEAKEKPKGKRRTATKKEPKKTTAKKGKSKSTPKKEELDKTEEVRRSSRIKSISVLKQRSRGHGLVKTPKPSLKTAPEVVENKPLATAAAAAAPAVIADEKPVDSPSSHHSHHSDFDCKPVKVKSRWRLSSELEMNVLTPASVVSETQGDSEKIAEATAALLEKPPPTVQQKDEEVEARLKQFVHLKENLYLTDRMSCKEAKKMTCDCFLTPEEIERGEFGCGEDCLNRLLMIECGNLCPVGDRCTNKKFQKLQFAPVEVFKTEKKGLGLRAAANVPYGEFILEYVGEVLDHEEFGARADDYSKDQNKHYYFMSLRADAIIDATGKGNISRFINHSCDPNAETQKWTVNGELRIGFFSTRTILAGEEITFDYRFQRYGKEAQKCYCEAPTCRGWLGEEPEDEDDDDEDDEEDEEAMQEEEEEEQEQEQEAVKVEVEKKVDEIGEGGEESEVKKDVLLTPVEPKPPRKQRKRVSPKRKPRKDKFEDLDQLDEEIDMVVTTGLKNQAHTLKLSRLMVRAKEPAQRTKLLRILRRGELPCRRLFLDYHGLRLMHGYMTDAQHLAKTDTKFENLRLEMLQTLATLPIPNKTMLQDSKVLPTVEKWSVPASAVNTTELMDSDSNSPQTEDVVASQAGTVADEVKTEIEDVKQDEAIKEDVEAMEVTEAVEATAEKTNEVAVETPESASDDKNAKPSKSDDQPNYEEEIIALALKLLEEWSNLKEVFKIPKKERIEQMKEHEREANKGYIAGLGLEPQDAEKKNESRYRILKRYRSIEKVDGSGPGGARKNIKLEDRTIVNFPKLGRDERRKMFALQVEQHEEERRRKQREMWRQHEQHCFLLGTDPRLTAPYDPSRSGYQCIWNPQIGQWQNYPIQNPNIIYNPQNPSPIPGMPMNMPPPNPNFPAYLQPNLHHVQSPAGMMPPPGSINQMHPLPALPYQEEVAKKNEDYTQVKFMGPIPPPAKLPAKWKCAKDKYGRPYYYHIRIRKSQWEPPPPPPAPEELDESSETTSSSDTSSLSSETSSDEMDSDDEINDTKLLIDVRKQMEKQSKISPAKAQPVHLKTEEDCETPSPVGDDGGISKEEEQEEEPTSIVEPTEEGTVEPDGDGESSTIDARIKDLIKEEKVQQTPPAKKRRSGLVHEIIISPRSEEDRQQFREDIKRYKQNKEKLKREKEQILQQTKKHVKEKRSKSTVKAKMKEMSDSNSKAAKNIKENFRSNMATVVVSVLNSYRKPDCKEGRITNTDDFKHLARKLTHFVMLKEMKHIEKIEDLVCTDNVKAKAREYIKKYMSKFGENYQKRNDEPDF